MQNIEIRQGVHVGLDDIVQGASKMETTDLEKLADTLNHLLARRKAVLDETEITLVGKIYDALKFEGLERYDMLQTKLANEVISDEEYQELLALTKVAEAQNVVWLQAIVDLARLRNVSPQTVIKQLGLDKRFKE